MSCKFYKCTTYDPCKIKCSKSKKKKCKCNGCIYGSCIPECNPCITQPNPCPTIAYSTTSPISTIVPTGTANTIGPITPIISFSTAPIINGGLGNTSIYNAYANGTITSTVTNITNTGLISNQTVSNNFAPIININNTIMLNTTNGQFMVPITGRYLITGFIGFIETVSSSGVGTRQFYIYKVDATTTAITLLSEDSRNAVVNGNTYISITTIADLNVNDKIYFAASQNSLVDLSTTTNSRFAINRLC